MRNFIVLCGPTCAGKTLGGALLAHRLGYKHVEASKIMRELCDREGTGLDIDRFAFTSLREAPERVPLQVLNRFGLSGVVLTGLRSPLEVETIRARIVDPLVAFISAPPETRLQRAKTRARPGHPMRLKELLQFDKLHADMGLQSIADHHKTVAVENVGSITEYESVLRNLAT